MNCDQVLRLLYDVIDKEASEIDTREVEAHLKRCPNCFKHYQLEGMVNDFILAKARNNSSEADLIFLKDRIVARLDEIDGQSGSGGSRRPFRLPVMLAVAAGALIMFVAAAFIASDFFRHSAEYIPLEEAHWTACEHLDRFTDRAAAESAVAMITSETRYTAYPEVQGFSMLGVCVDTVKGVPIGHYLYRNGEKLVSVFVGPADQLVIPDSIRQRAVNRDGLIFFDHNCRGCRLVYHQSGQTVIVTASTDREIDLLNFIPGREAA